MRRSLLLSVVAVGAIAAAVPAFAQDRQGRVGPSLTTSGRQLDPAGRLTALGNFPTGGALSPDGRSYWTVSAGHGINDVRILDVASGRVRQTLPLPGGYVGVAFAPDGRRAYVSGERTARERKSRYADDPALKGKDGDVVHVYDVDPTGQATEREPIAIPATQGGTYRAEGPLGGGPDDPSYPADLAVAPDGRHLVVALRNADRAAVIDLERGAVVAQPAVGAFPYGVAFDPVLPRAYVSNAYAGTVSVLEVPSGRVVATIPVGGQGAHAEGMIADPSRRRLYVAVANRDEVAIVDTDRLAIERTVELGRPEGLGTAPVALAISPDRQTLYVANANEDAVAGIALADRPAAGAGPRRRTVVTPRAPAQIAAYDRGYRRAQTARRSDLRRARTARARRAAATRFRRSVLTLRGAFLYGRSLPACGGVSGARERAYISRVRRIQRSRNRLLARTETPSRRRAITRAADRRLLAEFRRLPATRVCPSAGSLPGLKAFAVIGKIPTASYTTDVEATPDGRRLVWLAAKGLGAGPNPGFKDTPADPYPSYVADRLTGRAGVLDRPTDRELRAFTARTDRAIVPRGFASPPPGTPVVGPTGGASEKIRHVFYVVRENRTYDQLFGSEPRGDGDPSLQLFDDNGVAGPTGGVTPNAHALARRFPLLDHAYANSEVSIDGHIIAAGGYATDYTQKGLHSSYSGRGHADDVAVFPVSFPPNGFVFDQAVRGNVSFRAYGELGAGNSPFGNDGRPTYAQVVANTDAADYPSQVEGGCSTGEGPPALRCTTDAGRIGATAAAPSRRSRMDSFARQFTQQLATGTVPRFNYLIQYNDHTDGTRPGAYTPKAEIADNDLALGQLVETISNSPIWKESAIFVVEDDSQAGADHVDAHRMPVQVISPWARSGAVVTSRFDQYSFLRTAMMMVGLRPLSLNDALATPLYDAFVSGGTPPDLRPYRAIQPEQRLDEVNGPNAPLARLSAAMPWDLTDHVPQPIVDRILRASVFGTDTGPPRPGPNASPAELERMRGAMSAYRRGGRAATRSYLAANSEVEPPEAEEAEEWLKARALARTTGMTVEEAEDQLERAEEDEAPRG